MKQTIIAFLALLTLGACNHITGSGNIISEKRSPGDFHGVSVGGGFNVEIKIGPVREVIVEADDNVMERIRTYVDDGVLRIETRRLNSLTNVHMKVYVTNPVINTVRSSAGADVMVRNTIEEKDKVWFAASSGATIQAEVDAPEVEADASSSGTLKLSGNTRNFEASASSGADIKSWNLLSENTIVKASSGAKASVHASVKLKAAASSGGNIKYHGGAASTEIDESSGGDVNEKK